MYIAANERYFFFSSEKSDKVRSTVRGSVLEYIAAVDVATV